MHLLLLAVLLNDHWCYPPIRLIRFLHHCHRLSSWLHRRALLRPHHRRMQLCTSQRKKRRQNRLQRL
jgi:hypothetical protein